MQSSTGQPKVLWSGEMGSPQPLRDAVGQGSQDWDSPQDQAKGDKQEVYPFQSAPQRELYLSQDATCSRQHYQLIRDGTQEETNLPSLDKLCQPQGLEFSKGTVRGENAEKEASIRTRLPCGKLAPTIRAPLGNPTCSPAISVLDTTETFQSQGQKECQATVT